ncbi:MAG: DUF1616 domain-containing protein [Candidatus Bathyarchaeota archaeon]|nr:DUF1616 domain-containing protein [Candidatus Bathyarchaeota archaeon]
MIGVLLFSWPTIGLVVKPPEGEVFSELYILGSNHMFDDIPFNVKAGVTYSIYLGVGNHMGSSCYYTCFVKLRNETEPLPNTKSGTPSSLPVLYEFKSFIKNDEYWESPLTFKVNHLVFANGVSYLSGITINEQDFQVSTISAWNTNKTGYYYSLFVELWIYNSTSNASQFHNRYVNLILNMTQ